MQIISLILLRENSWFMSFTQIMVFISLNGCAEVLFEWFPLPDYLIVSHRLSATLCWCHAEGLHNKQHWSREVFFGVLHPCLLLCWFSVFRMFRCSIHSLQFSCSPSFIYRHLYYLVTWRYAIGASFSSLFRTEGICIVRALCKFTTNVQPVSAPLLHITMATACCITPNRKVSPVRLRGNHVSLTPFPFFPAVLRCPSISASLSPLAFMVFLHLCVISPFSAL